VEAQDPPADIFLDEVEVINLDKLNQDSDDSDQIDHIINQKVKKESNHTQVSKAVV
jgi:hypothetical protein